MVDATIQRIPRRRPTGSRSTEALFAAMRAGAGRTLSDVELERLLHRMAAGGQVVEHDGGWCLSPSFEAVFGVAFRSCGFDDDRADARVRAA